jgi:2-octaprenyl-6-methoxyphenol hydroxylase
MLLKPWLILKAGCVVDMNKMPIIIVGSGPVGAVLALVLQMHGVDFIILEARKMGASHEDKRALALSYGSRMILEKLGIWNDIETNATAINSIHVSQRGGFGRTKLNAKDHDLQALGYVVAYGVLTKALDGKLDRSKVLYESIATQIKPDINFAQVKFELNGEFKSITSALVVIADGGGGLSAIEGIERETKDYGHNAIVSKVSCELPHDNIAYERFTPNGPMALLPNGEREFSLVWTGEKKFTDALLDLDDATFLNQLHVAFGDRVGKFMRVEKRASFPLKLSILKSSYTQHLVFIGNAAQTMHPVAGQGFNVGLRDAWTLADMLIEPHLDKLGSEEMLKNYSKKRKQDTSRGVLFTDFLVNAFTNDLIGISSIRGMGLGFVDIVKPAKNLLVNKMSFGN